MKGVVFQHFGEPAEVLQVCEMADPEAGSGQVVVRMIASPINPSDLLVVRGQYGKLPELPATPGFEGVGVVESGGGLMGLRVRKKRVAVLNGRGGNWREKVVIPVRNAVPLPDDIPDEQAASFFVNPATALVMINFVLAVPKDAWVLQTAAGSALGRMIIRLGVRQGFRTLNLVRREDTAEELRQLGGDAVVNTSDSNWADMVRKVTDKKGVPFALDAVGGELASTIVEFLGPGGRMLCYGTLSGQPMEIDPRALMVAARSVGGFWLSEWVGKQNPLTMLLLFRQIKKLMKAGVLTTEVAERYELNDVATAVRRAEIPGRVGKILLKMS